MCVWRRRRTKHKVLKLPFQTVIRGFHVRAVHTPNNSRRCVDSMRPTFPWTDILSVDRHATHVALARRAAASMCGTTQRAEKGKLARY